MPGLDQPDGPGLSGEAYAEAIADCALASALHRMGPEFGKANVTA